MKCVNTMYIMLIITADSDNYRNFGGQNNNTEYDSIYI